ncbi:MAG TPA: glycosyltransferase family 2 protein [Actinomycetota bacterium]|nr:glycosyltransferase family 2 protein [Actinomycetota bacterium]
MRTLALPRADRPLVSVVMVTFGGWALTRRALEALAKHTELPFEVVIVDNPTPEDVATRLGEEVTGAEVLENDRNEGFGPAANRGAEQSRGELVLFLNTDTLVGPGWLEPLVETLGSDPGVGAVVPMFLNEDGTVQEAGGLLFEDASTLMYGYGESPTDPEYRFRRAVDYGSAACLLLRRADFLEAGAFDPAFVPAYCEDVDLQLRLRERGRRTVYEPRSSVVHVRFGSSGLDERAAAGLVEKHAAILRERWGHVLAERPPRPEPGVPEQAHRVLAARDADAVVRVLVVAPSSPDQLLQTLVDRQPSGRITMLATDSPSDFDRLGSMGVECQGPLDDADPWLRSRRFHYTVVLAVADDPDETIRAALEEHQPQAPILRCGDADEADAALTRAGVPPERLAGAQEGID